MPTKIPWATTAIPSISRFGSVIATLNTLTYRLASSLSLTALQRFYSYKYYSLFSESFADGNRIQNESGFYFGANWQALPSLTLFSYFDYAYSPWAKCQVDFSSHSHDWLVQVTYTYKRWTLMGHCRLRIREKNNEKKTALIDETTQRGPLYTFSFPAYYGEGISITVR